MAPIRILGAGPAGSSAALSALASGAAVELIEKSTFPRHKVCGEYLSAEVAPLLESLHVWDAFQAAQPARIERLVLSFPSSEKRCKLPEPSFGLSRFRFDHLLMRQAELRGATLTSTPSGPPQIIAHGRRIASKRGGRLFGFKAHWQGPADDAIELFFFRGGYVGVNAIENGATNVCGLATEEVLGAHGFQIDDLLHSCPAARQRLSPLTRAMNWMTTGPLVFENQLRTEGASAGPYLAGDALSFVDPFTGSGMLCALATGRLAGRAAAHSQAVNQYLEECRSILHSPFELSALIRAAVDKGWAEKLVGMVPARLLVHWTRPRSAALK